MATKLNNVVDLSNLSRNKYLIKIEGEEKELYLNPADASIITRISEIYPKLNSLDEKTKHINDVIGDEDTITEEEIVELGKRLHEIDFETRELIDSLFESNVSEVCAPYGSMFDTVDGVFRFEIIIDSLLALYAENIREETNKRLKRMKSHTAKYTAQDHKKSSK